MANHNSHSRESTKEVWDYIPDDGSWISLVDLAALVGSTPSSIGRRLNAIRDRVARSTHDGTEKGIKEVRRLPVFCRYPYNLPVR
jgi:hypothetical protein